MGDFSPTSSATGQLIVARYTAGVLDTSFNGTGYSILSLPGVSYTTVVNSHNDVALQSDGRIVVVSSSSAPGGSHGTLVVRYTTGGALDPTFGGGNGYIRLATGTNYGGQEVVIQPDQEIVVVSEMNESNHATVAVTRLNRDGTLDTSFGSGGLKLATVAASVGVGGVALQSDGSIIVAGTEGTGSTAHPVLMRFYGTTTALLSAGPVTGTPATQALTFGATLPLVNQALVHAQQTGGAGTSHVGYVDLIVEDTGGATHGRAVGHTIAHGTHAAVRNRVVVRTTRPGRVPQAARMDPLSGWITR